MFIETNNSLDRPAPIYGREKHPAPNGATKSFGAVVSINISPLRGSKQRQQAVLSSNSIRGVALARARPALIYFACHPECS